MTSAGPTAVALTAVLVVTVVLCGVALVQRGRGGEPQVVAAEANHLLMAVAMVAMTLPATVGVVPGSAGVAAFGLLALGWAAAVVVRGRGASLSPLARAGCAANPLHLALVNLAMVAMYGAMDVMMTGGGATLLALDLGVVALAFYLLLHAGATIGALLAPRTARTPVAVGAPDPSGPDPSGPAPTSAPDGDSARAPLLCETLMGLTMAWMLLALIS